MSAQTESSKEPGSIGRERLLSATGMSAPEDAREVRDLDVGVALGRGKGAVAQEGLDVMDVGAALEEMSGHLVAQSVAGRVLLDARLPGRGLDDVVEERVVHPPPAAGQKEPWRPRGSGDVRTAVVERVRSRAIIAERPAPAPTACCPRLFGRWTSASG